MSTEQLNVEELQKKFDKISNLATELAQYASYAEIIGAISHNRLSIRKYCDEIFEFNRKLEAEEELLYLKTNEHGF